MSQEPYQHARQGVGTLRSALVVQRGGERIYPFYSQLAKVEPSETVRKGVQATLRW